MHLINYNQSHDKKLKEKYGKFHTKNLATERLKVKWQKNGKVTEEHANFEAYHREEKNPREALILIMSSGYVVFDKASDRVQVISSSSQNRNKLKS